jgi:hypothetical protein
MLDRTDFVGRFERERLYRTNFPPDPTDLEPGGASLLTPRAGAARDANEIRTKSLRFIDSGR